MKNDSIKERIGVYKVYLGCYLALQSGILILVFQSFNKPNYIKAFFCFIMICLLALTRSTKKTVFDLLKELE